MFDVLADNPVLTLSLVVGLGSALGLVPFGPIRFGPAGALFVGLALGAMDDRLGEGLGLARTIGLALFVYTVGLSSGSILIRTFRRQLPLMAGSALVLVTLLTHRLGMSPARSGGLIAGFVGNPSLLAFATSRVADERVNEGYATLFAIDTILKVLLVQVIVGVAGG
jgi:putative transport protein